MKNLFTIVLVAFLLSSMSYSQSLRVTGGVDLMSIDVKLKAGGNNPTDNGPAKAEAKIAFNKADEIDKYSGSSNETGFYIGLALSDLTIVGNLEIQPEIRFVGVKDFNQIQTPILLKYKIADKFSAHAGPSFGFLLDSPEGIDSFNVALDFGMAYDFTEKFSLEARYDWGQTNLLENGDSDNYLKLSNFQIGVVYNFGSKNK